MENMGKIYQAKVLESGKIPLPVELMKYPVVFVSPTSRGYVVRSEEKFDSLPEMAKDQKRRFYALSDDTKIEFGKLVIPSRMRKRLGLRRGQEVELYGSADEFFISLGN